MQAASTIPALKTRQPTPSTAASSQGMLCVWHGLTVGGLFRMLRHQPEFAWSYLPRWCSIAAASIFNSLENAAESLIHRRRIARTTIEHPPIFVLGHWRSGTTLLHSLMTLDPQVTYVTLYECLYPGHFLLTENVIAPLTRWMLPQNRPMDNVPAAWDAPQEDEIGVALDCGISPYLMVAFHDRPEVYNRFFDPREMTDEERSTWRNSLLRLMKKVTIRNNRPIVLKSPTHTFRIPILLEMFPEAKFIYIYRDPYAVYRSTVHLRHTMFVENSLSPPKLEAASRETLAVYEKCIHTYEDTKSLIPAGNLHELRFEDLEADPMTELEKVYHGLNLPGWDQLQPRIEAQMPTLKAYRKNAFKMDPETRRMVYNRLKWAFELYGYPSRLDEELTAGCQSATKAV